MTDLSELTAHSREDLAELLSDDVNYSLAVGDFKSVLVLGECADGNIRSSDSGLTVKEALDLVDKWLVQVRSAALEYSEPGGLKRFH